MVENRRDGSVVCGDLAKLVTLFKNMICVLI